MTTDPAIINLPLNKRGGPSIDTQIDRALAEQRREAIAAERERRIERKAARHHEKVRPKMTADDVRGAVLVRTSHGWHRVVRVSAKSVTVTTPFSWTERIPLDRVLEVRHADQPSKET